MWLWLWAMLSRLLELLRTMWPFSLLSPAPAAVSVAGKAVLITGCDSGFGYSMALHCLRRLDMLVIAACHCGHGRGGAAALAAAGAAAVLTDFDVTEERSAEAARREVERVLDEQGEGAELWAVVNNAAALVFAETEWQTRRQIDMQMKVNVTGPAMLVRKMLPLLRRSGGRVVNVTSVSARHPVPFFGPYGASKAALEALSAALRIELRKYRVDVVLLEPGDAPDRTPLCGRQARYHEEMRAGLTAEEEAAFGGHFGRCSSAICSMFDHDVVAGSSKVIISDAGFYRTLTSALTDSRPRAEYFNHSRLKRLKGWLKEALTPEEVLAREKLDMIPVPKYVEGPTSR